MKKTGLIIFFILLCSVFSFAEDQKLKQELEKVLAPDLVAELVKNGQLLFYKYRNKDMNPKVILKIPVMERISEKVEKQNLKPAFILESLHLYKKDTDKQIDSSKILRSISKLEGLEYFSHSRGKMRTLYVKSFVVEKLKETKKSASYKTLPDPVDVEADGLSFFALQEDLNFGANIYKYEYFANDNDIGMICFNTETLKYSIFRVISPENLKLVLVVHDLGEHLLIYSRTMADFSRLPGLEKKLKNSFSARAEAMYNWFIDEYKKEGLK